MFQKYKLNLKKRKKKKKNSFGNVNNQGFGPKSRRERVEAGGFCSMDSPFNSVPVRVEHGQSFKAERTEQTGIWQVAVGLGKGTLVRLLETWSIKAGRLAHGGNKDNLVRNAHWGWV